MIYFVPEGRRAVRRARPEQPRRVTSPPARRRLRPRLRRAGHRDLLQLLPRLSYGRRSPAAWDFGDARAGAGRPARRGRARPCAGPGIHELPVLDEVLALARRAAEAACEHPQGRPLFAAHAALPWPDEPLLQLWHAQTLLREFRGDGHVACLLSEGVGPLDALVLHAATGEVPVDFLKASRAGRRRSGPPPRNACANAASSTATHSAPRATPCASTSRTAPTAGPSRLRRALGDEAANAWPNWPAPSAAPSSTRASSNRTDPTGARLSKRAPGGVSPSWWAGRWPGRPWR